MFKRLRNAFHEWWHWRRIHDLAWAPYLVLHEDGLNGFQHETERRIVGILMLRGLCLSNRHLEGFPPSEPQAHDGTLAVCAEIPELEAEIWICDDQTEIAAERESLRLERWGLKTPDEHFSIVEDFLTGLLDSTNASRPKA
jgi:hypothetical protein